MSEYSQMEKNTVSAKGQLKDNGRVCFQNPAGRRVRIMFVGNSITLHGEKPEIGWNHRWGMAASSKEKDYVNCIMKTVKEKEEDAAFCICQVAEWERNYLEGNKILNKYELARKFDADIIIVRIVENCPKTGFEHSVFKEELDTMLKYLNGKENAKYILTTGFWKHPGDDAIRQLAKEKNWPLVELGDLGEDDKMKAIGMFEHNGVANHPGDLGMKTIAERIMAELSNMI